MSSQGTDVSLLTEEELYEVFEQELGANMAKTLIMTGAAVKILSNTPSVTPISSGKEDFEIDLQLFAKKKDIKQIESVAKEFKMSPQLRREFGDYVESLKDLVPNNKNFSYKELIDIAKEFLGGN